ncbi:MAG TPA: HlyD family efflux transporter periplasmic adaptor subunit [Desulfovibrio sp.]|uniref:HlyD family secretion protein n=1 Tax=Desulfovibrio sp. TaxID=885 RepID=UPI002D5E4C7F|nr:HlyD family efflux transporter periplasmic adaptor subunit [Desulfovibrio sp.]HZF60691.1 HlyD family efflux transporter periplasmic adaptor subunit [Desulfovibrio sp.]
MNSLSVRAKKMCGAVLCIILCVFWGSLLAAGQGEEMPSAPIAEVLASAKGRVDVEGGVIKLAARRDGVITAVMAEEGETVQAGRVLACLDDSLARNRLNLAEQELRHTELQVRRNEIVVRAAQRELERLRPMIKTRAVAMREFDQAGDALVVAEVDLRSSIAAVEVARARVVVAQNEVNEYRIVAPLDGRIVQRQARPGNGVSTLNVTPLFSFVPNSPLIVRAELDEQYLSQASPGQHVLIVPESDQFRTMNGTVLRIGRVVGQRLPPEDPAEKQDTRVVEVVTTLEADSLLIGQRVVVRFLADGGSSRKD